MAARANSLFILGAGFTKAVIPNAPLNAELLNALIAEGFGPTLTLYRDKYKTEDIEELLTQLDLESSKCQQIKVDRTKINAEIASFFSKFRYSEICEEEIPWLEIFVKNLLQPNDAIITLNYDCLLEGALDNYEVWTPNGGYAKIENPLADSIPKNPKGILVYKIHGSEHFVESSVANNRHQTAIGFIIDPSLFPKSGAHTHFGGGAIDPRPYIIAPSFVKIPHVEIAAIMLESLNAAELATNLVIIGCSMRPEDNFLWLLLTRFLNTTLRQRKRLIILSPSSDAIWNRISNYWIGDICRFTDVVVIPCSMESAVQSLIETIGREPG